MPVKARVSKRRTGSEVELAAWSEVFEEGHTFFADLDALGVSLEPTRTWRDPVYPAMVHSNADEVFNTQARKAWCKLGAGFLRRRGRLDQYGKPWWALAEFGEP